MSTTVIVIGAGHNGLTTACSLAKAGRKVLVLEQRDVVGGLSAGEEFHPGYRTAGVLHDTGGVRPWVIEQLGLEQHGLDTFASPAAVFAPQREGRGLVLHHQPELAEQELRTFSAKDVDRYAEFRAFLDKVRGALGSALDEIPPDVIATARGKFMPVAKQGLAFRRLGANTMTELLRIPPMAVADWMGDWFETELVRATLAAPGVFHAFTGPWSPGSAGSLLHFEMTNRINVKGGPAALATSLEAAAKAAGVEIRTGARVERIVVEKNQVRGVRLAGGETLDAGLVASAADPRATILDLLEPAAVPFEFEHRVRYFRGEGTTAKVNLAIAGAPNWKSRPGERFARVRIAETIDGMERAYDPVKYGEIPNRPMLDIFVPTVDSPDLAPKGSEVLSILVHTAPYKPTEGWTPQNRQDLENAVLDTLELYTPGIKKQIAGREVLTPTDLEARYGAVRGHLLHGDHALDQTFIRPVPECAQYATPLQGLYLCGSGSWPGGGVTAAPGALAARRILADN